MRKASAILEYGVVITIAALFLAGINVFLRRHIEARVKAESDTTIGHGLGLEWPEQTYTIGGSRRVSDRNDALTQVRRDSSSSEWSITYSQPIGSKIMKHKRASRHVQDPAVSPPAVNYPRLEYKEWDDQNWPI
jgi:hypothetical protein